MSNFAARLDELMERAAAGKYPDVWGRVALIEYLVNHAPAIRDLVRAAENVLIGGNHLACLIGNHPPYGTAPEIVRRHYLPHHQDMYEAWCCWNEIMLLREALAKLEEA